MLWFGIFDIQFYLDQSFSPRLLKDKVQYNTVVICSSSSTSFYQFFSNNSNRQTYLHAYIPREHLGTTAQLYRLAITRIRTGENSILPEQNYFCTFFEHAVRGFFLRPRKFKLSSSLFISRAFSAVLDKQNQEMRAKERK